MRWRVKITMKAALTGLILCLAAPAQSASLEFLSSFIWPETGANFGGFSALELSADGTKFTTVSDKGRFMTGTLSRKSGQITNVTSGPIRPLHGQTGGPLKRFDTDSEGLAIGADGQYFVSFEGNHRVWRYDDPEGAANKTGHHEDFRKFQNNSGLEALAIDANGVLYTLPERSGELDRPFPVYTYQNQQWETRFSIPRRGEFLPVGADFGPDGKFYLLERDFVWYKGFASRVRRFDMTPEGATNEETLLVTPFGMHDNLEGIAAWQDQSGRLRLSMISDDNFSYFQVTEFVEYAVVEDK